MKEEKLNQLRKVFQQEVRSILLTDIKNVIYPDKYIKNKAKQLIYEVKIRINNKEE